MKRFLIFLLILTVSEQLNAQSNLKLWYKQPSQNWNEALPIGNGRLGAMVFGNVTDELIQLNEQSLWSGGPVNTNPNPKAVNYLADLRKALDQEDYKLAEQLAKKMQGPFTESYEPLGDLHIKQTVNGAVSNYYRDLDIANAIAITKFTADGINYMREQFVSEPDQVIVVRLTANKKAALNFSVFTNSPLEFKNGFASDDEIIMKGSAPAHTDPSYLQTDEIPITYHDQQACKGMRFELRVKAKIIDGVVRVSDTGIEIKDASEVILFLSAATSFNGFDKCPDKEGKDEDQIAKDYLTKAFAKSYDDILSKHVSQYQKYFNRVDLNIVGKSFDEVPTDERLKQYTAGSVDIGLEQLYFQFGRYLLISSSPPNGLPANLQGIWNKEIRPPWSSNYTTNINTEMNYWMAETGNLNEQHEALINQIKRLSITGKETARNFYNAPGWVLHHNSDIWAHTNPVSGSPTWANWPMGSAWLCQHLWERFVFSGDKKFLQEQAYPIMKEAAAFYLAWLIENKNGQLVTSPSTSPENEFITDKGIKASVSVATTMDMALIKDLFTNLIQASEQLKIDEEYRKVLIEKTKKLFPFQIGKKGNLQEWFKDWEDVDPHHRHVSHLFGLYPGRSITPSTTPVLAAAVKKSLELRGDEGTGWSKGWKINLWARLLDGNHAYKLIREQLKYTTAKDLNYKSGGTYPNLFDAHPPFQIDGNFAGTSGMIEMLLQSHDGAVHLLPALPDVWKTGKLNGLKARGGFEIVSMEWKEGEVTKLIIKSNLGGNLRMRLPNKIKLAKGKLNIAKATNTNLFYNRELINFKDPENAVEKLVIKPVFEYDVETVAGGIYRFTH